MKVSVESAGGESAAKATVPSMLTKEYVGLDAIADTGFDDILEDPFFQYWPETDGVNALDIASPVDGDDRSCASSSSSGSEQLLVSEPVHGRACAKMLVRGCM